MKYTKLCKSDQQSQQTEANLRPFAKPHTNSMAL